MILKNCRLENDNHIFSQFPITSRLSANFKGEDAIFGIETNSSIKNVNHADRRTTFTAGYEETNVMLNCTST